MDKLRFAILGAGRIARTMADTVRRMDGVELWAVAARQGERARAFAEEFGIPRAYGSYRQLLCDPGVELVYIATPHSHHADHMNLCLQAGKHVLCEKPFTVNAAQAAQVLDLARRKNLLAAEAIWPRYMPMAGVLRDFCAGDRIGRITGLTANLGYPVTHKERILRRDLAGGALLDIGVYCLTFASICFGDDVEHFHSHAVMGATGVDLQSTVSLTYGDGRTASLYSTALAATDRRGMICGDQGYAVVENINNFQSLQIFTADHRPVEKIPAPPQLTGYEYEVQAAAAAIRAGRCECPAMPHSEILRMMEWMDTLRARWGLRYPMEEQA